MLRAVTWVRAHRYLSATCARLAARRHSSCGNQKGPLADRVAVVTGSTNGIGLAMARRLARDGAHVVVSSRKQQNVDRAVATLQGEGLSVTGIVCHVGKAEDRERLVAKAVEHCGAVDILVCNAAVNPLIGSTLGASEEVWNKVLDVNLKSPALLLRRLLPHMEKRSGVVILVSSISAYTPMMELGVYNVSKTALLGLTKTLALELAHKDIRVNCLVPGVIYTDFSKVVYENDAVIWNLIKKCYNIQRMGQPEDCAGIVSFLCSPEASYITGESIVVAGCSPRL
ncbi:dehydrogenase/reductase SDR family member 2, mitochondrial-like [Sorex araneus]|uniref:dehydrogenase/reductase SDR family member 2, mitochondrial-like n=1 Tax=Sorex araneus TaxID=42254 RepID=UPI00064AD0DF|nr:dehydrogenase/reductase SDR family member 2, mitochondrial-like [Sorex araneus]XP_054989958.1 dehydrogenase/reductase SDR family member 2, mitochondrial-like [Sorex araneus]XP_054989959.1 dehydrogenase/reductase SDR family member 2, mitochondrial-like [Sorex araneus]XP_054989961.1 dehydrogenase/reductase SDR family member 2, mitochondrial-like [Sorex araneus]XP_054989962.1 dehydrogenase/reductase SDR family member 2, mitochondrial-like [Sorex araneus]XP_054989963.1 dehydrogenase/reductase S